MKPLVTLILAMLVCGACATGGDAPVAEEPTAANRAPAGASDMGRPGAIDAERLASEGEDEPRESGDLAALREAAERAPDDPQAHRRLGLALRRVRRDDEALQHLERAAELAPDDADVLLSLGIAYSAVQRAADAEATYRQILKSSPGHAKAHNNLGNVALRRGDEDAAIESYRRAVEADPQYLSAMHKLADLLKYRGLNDEAYAIYERILELKPSDPRERLTLVESLYGLGSINLARERFELAEQQLAQVVRFVPNHRSAHWARAQALIQLGRDDEAQQELQAHVRILQATPEGS